MHGNKAKPICTAIRPSSKILNFDLYRNNAKLRRFSLALLLCNLNILILSLASLQCKLDFKIFELGLIAVQIGLAL